MSKIVQNNGVTSLYSMDLEPNETYTFTVMIPLVYPVYEHIGPVKSPVRTLDMDGNEILLGNLSIGNFDICHPDDDTFEIRIKSWA